MHVCVRVKTCWFTKPQHTQHTTHNPSGSWCWLNYWIGWANMDLHSKRCYYVDWLWWWLTARPGCWMMGSAVDKHGWWALEDDVKGCHDNIKGDWPGEEIITGSNLPELLQLNFIRRSVVTQVTTRTRAHARDLVLKKKGGSGRKSLCN